ncbi:MAG: hypothetical protein WAR22_03805 [Desulfomonilia bacterium]
MKKVLCTIALMLLVSGSAYAQATFSLTGNYWAEGKYWFNYNAGPGIDAEYNDNSFGFYEQDINLFPKISIGNTSLNFKVVITDTYWGATQADNDTNETGLATTDNDDNIAIERAFLTHKFDNGLMLDVGLMDGTVWGTSFADDTTAQWRVKLMGMTKVGMLGAVLEKNIEDGAFGLDQDADWSEGEDRDSYGLFAISKVGDVYIKPLLWYVDANDAFPGSGEGMTIFNPVLAFDGELAGLSFEAEFNYKMYSFESSVIDEDWETLGIYLNFWKALDSMTPGIVLAYGSQDNSMAKKVNEGKTELQTLLAGAELGDPTAQARLEAFGGEEAVEGVLDLYDKINYFTSFDFEDDFNSTVILGDEYGWGGGDDLRGMTLIKLYVNDIKTGMDPLTLSAYAAYVMSNEDDTAFEDATAWELGLGAAYKITDNLVYSVYGAYADISYDVTGIDDPDSVYMIANAIEFSF